MNTRAPVRIHDLWQRRTDDVTVAIVGVDDHARRACLRSTDGRNWWLSFATLRRNYHPATSQPGAPQ